MQSWDLDRKISVSLARIAEFYNKFPHRIYVSYSGGKDSTVLLHLVRRLYPDTPAVFIDTGLEYPELRNLVKTINNVVWIKPEMNFRKVIKKYGYPIISKEVSRDVGRTQKNKGINSRTGEFTYSYKSLNGLIFDKNGNKSIYCKEKWKFLLNAPFKVSNLCCDIMKKNPLHKYEKETGFKPIIGTMACESKQRKSHWLHDGCNAFDKKNPSSQPMSFWTEQDVLEYILRYDLQYASVYGDIVQDKKGKYHTTGCQRTGCIFCGFGCHLEKEPNRFQRLKETHPKLWGYCMKPWSDGGLGMKEVLEFIGVKIE